MATQLPPPKKGGTTPNFRPMSVMAKRLIGLRCHLVWRYKPRPRRLRWGPSSPRKKGTAPTQFLAYVYCGQRVGWMKTPLGAEVDLGPGHIVLDGAKLTPRKGHSSPPLFGPYLLWPWSPISAAAELLFHDNIFQRILKIKNLVK